MRALLWVACAEWRYWLRSRLAVGAVALLLVLLGVTTASTALRMAGERAERMHHQAEAEAVFLAQPDRHPHRMVHYGHYVFRTPPPLALFDPGIDAVTGQAIFLEGHRQNTAMFAPAGASADAGALSSLSPASVYQLFAPLLLVLLGYGAIAREREAGTLSTLLAQGLGGRPLLAGKALALLSAVLLLLVPLAASAVLAVTQGERVGAVLALLAAYGLYLAIWAALALAVSTLVARRSAVLASLTALWIALALALPSVAVSTTAAAVPVAGKIERDLAMLEALRELGDGYNASAPAFAQLRADLLAQHGVERVEDLPFNLRGVVAQVAEERLTETLNAYARAHRSAEARVAQALARQGWLTPMLAVAEVSRAITGTDLAHHHRFLEQAEALRYAFVQGLNRVHAQRLAYADDIRRSIDAEAERRTRVDASHWQVLQAFHFAPEPVGARLQRAGTPIAMLALWLGLLCAGLFWLGGRLKP